MGNVASSPFDSGYFIFTFVISIISGLVLIGGLVINGLRLHYRHSSWEMHFDRIEPKTQGLGSKLKLGLNGKYTIRATLICRETTILSEHTTFLGIGIKPQWYTTLWRAIQMRRANKTLLVPPSWSSWDVLAFPHPTYVANCPLEIKGRVRVMTDTSGGEIKCETVMDGTRYNLRFNPPLNVGINHKIILDMDVVTGDKWSGIFEFASDVYRTEQTSEGHRVSRAIEIGENNT